MAARSRSGTERNRGRHNYIGGIAMWEQLCDMILSEVQSFCLFNLLEYFNCTAEMFGSGSKFSARSTEEYSRLFGEEGVKTHRQNPPPFCRAVGLRDAASLHVASIRLIWSIHGSGGDADDDDAGVDYL